MKRLSTKESATDVGIPIIVVPASWTSILCSGSKVALVLGPPTLSLLGGLPSGRPLSFAPTRLPILSLFPALSYRTSLTLLLLADDTLYRAGPKVPVAASRRRRRN